MDNSTKKVMFSKKSDEWSTAQEFYDKLDGMFNFTLDPCATHENHKCEKYFTMEDDGLAQSWEGESVFVNPPYSQTEKWLEKGYTEACLYPGTKTKVVVLIPSRTDTKYFHKWCMHASKIYFVKGRLKFGEQKNSAPFPSMVVVFDFPYPCEFENSPEIASIERK